MLVLAVDPGLSGAIAFLGSGWCKVIDLPTVPIPGEGTIGRRVHGPSLQALLLANIPADAGQVHFVIEALSTGGQAGNAQTIGSQYRTRGTIEGLVECLGLEVHEVYARTWKKFFGLAGKKTGADDPASQARAKAARLYPDLADDLRLVKHHNRAEAVLVGHWFKRQVLKLDEAPAP